MQRVRVVLVLLSWCGPALGQTFEPHSTQCIETAPLGLWSPWVQFDETEFSGQWFVADGPLGGSCSSGGGYFVAGSSMESGVPVDLRELGPGNRFITAILKKNDDSIRPIRMVWNVEITEPGDVDGDGVVNFSDFITISRAYGDEADRRNGDLDYSGEVGFEDFMILTQNYGAVSAARTADVANVPEPASHLAASAFMALMCIGGLRQRRADCQVQPW